MRCQECFCVWHVRRRSRSAPFSRRGPLQPFQTAGARDGPSEPPASTATERSGDSAAATEATPPDDRSVAELLTDLQRLYREAGKATEAYNAAEERLAKQRAETRRLDRALAVARLSLHDSRGAAGRLARQQYQGSTGISCTCGCCWPAIRSTRSTRDM